MDPPEPQLDRPQQRRARAAVDGRHARCARPRAGPLPRGRPVLDHRDRPVHRLRADVEPVHQQRQVARQRRHREELAGSWLDPAGVLHRLADALHRHNDDQPEPAAEVDLPAHAAVVRPVHPAVPRRCDALLDHDQPLDDPPTGDRQEAPRADAPRDGDRAGDDRAERLPPLPVRPQVGRSDRPGRGDDGEHDPPREGDRADQARDPAQGWLEVRLGR